ncbi:MAG: cache domain-containing protein, partial [Oscillospiraceae bacterium]|nr:cache domain-containing protein [Oscillospiraceae bacterium]
MLKTTETSSLKTASQVAANVFQHDFEQSAEDTVTLAELLASDENLLVALQVNDAAAVQTVWEGLHKNDGIFAFFTNPDGALVYQTDNCNISSESIFNMTSANRHGLYVSANDPLFYCTSVITRNGTVGVGYSYNSNLLVDNIMAQTDSQATIFADNIRIATTVTTEDGERATGTLMLDNIYQTVIKDGQIYQQETEIFGKKYMATYTPIKDDNGTVRGALFTGAPMEQSLKNRFIVTIISISLGVVMLVVSSAVFLRFVTVHISQPVAMVKTMATEMEIGNLRGNPGIRGKVDDNEIGDLARALASAITTLDGYISDISDMMREMSDGN